MMSQVLNPLRRPALPALAAGLLAASPAASAPAAPAADPAQLKQQAADFVRSYGDFTSGPLARARQTGRWGGQPCVQVAGVPLEEQDAVRTRIEEVGKSIDLTVQPEDCEQPNVEIVFTADPQAELDKLVKHDRLILGDRTSNTRDAKTVTLPIQAWYVTNGVTFAQNDRRHLNGSGPAGSDLKVRVVYQAVATPCHCDLSGISAASVNGGYQGGAYEPPNGSGIGTANAGNANFGYPTGPVGAGPPLGAGARLFTNVLVIIDMSRPQTRGRKLGLLADYATMLALSEPRALGQCNVLPSITDLFANCQGRPAPDGLTPADAAYLTALYPQKGGGVQYGDESLVAERMAKILAGDGKVASR